MIKVVGTRTSFSAISFYPNHTEDMTSATWRPGHNRQRARGSQRRRNPPPQRSRPRQTTSRHGDDPRTTNRAKRKQKPAQATALPSPEACRSTEELGRVFMCPAPIICPNDNEDDESAAQRRRVAPNDDPATTNKPIDNPYRPSTTRTTNRKPYRPLATSTTDDDGRRR
jgi:hypothetical protein